MENLNNYFLKAVFSFFVFAGSQTVVSAQEIAQPLELNEAIESSVANNKTVALSKMDEAIADLDYKQTSAVFLPQAGFSYTGITTNNPLNAFGFKLQQQSIKQDDFNPNLLNNPPATTDFTTRIDVKQPLLNLDLLYMRKSAKKQVEISRYKTQRTKEYITYMVQQAYLQLQLAYDAEKVLEEALSTAKAMFNFTNDRFEQGLLQKSDVLNAQVQVNSIETNLAEAKSHIKNASDDLSLLMGKATGTIYTIPASFSFHHQVAADSLPSDRSDFKAMETAINSYDLMIKSGRMSYLPKLNAFGSYQLNDKTMFGFGSNAYLAGVQLSWDIFKGNTTKNKIAAQEIERHKLSQQLSNEQDKDRVELNKARRDFDDAQYKINQQKAAVGQAAEALRILQNRYEQGLANSTDVLMAQTQLSQQKLALAQAMFSRNISAAFVQFLTTANNE